MTRGRCSTRALTALVVTLLAACDPAPRDGPTAEAPAHVATVLDVYAVNYPLYWLASELGKEAVAVTLPVPAGVDPAHWQPSPEVMLAYQSADLVLLNGAGYAPWVQSAALSPARVVDTSRAERARYVPSGERDHAHGPTGAHTHGGIATHTWLDPTMAAAQAQAVARALARRLPEHAESIERRADELQKRFAGFDADLSLGFQRVVRHGVLYSHPVYQYLDARYGLGGTSLAWEPGEDPGEDQWRELEGHLREQPAALMLWEAEPLPGVADRLRRLGVEPLVFDTAAAPGESGDYLQRMWANVQRLSQHAKAYANDGP